MLPRFRSDELTRTHPLRSSSTCSAIGPICPRRCATSSPPPPGVCPRRPGSCSGWRPQEEPAWGGHPEQLGMLERVLELWDCVPDAAERIGADHVQVLQKAGAVAESAGEPARGLLFAATVLEATKGARGPK
jgi:hypothetical protein